MSIAAYQGSVTTKANADVFIPELWSTEITRYRDQALILLPYTKKLMFTGGKKGDRLHIPNIGRMAVNKKLAETPVTLQARTETSWYIDITQYTESSFMIEDIVSIQADYNLRSEYTREAGYALGRDINNYVLGMRAAFRAIAAQNVFSSDLGDISASAVSKPISYASILAAKLLLDNADVPDEGRVLFVSPTQYVQLLTVAQFINRDYVGNNSPVVNGIVGEIAGIPVFKTSLITANSTTGYTNGTGASGQPTPGVTSSPYLPDQDTWTTLETTWNTTANTTTATRAVHTAMLMHSDAIAMAIQKEPSSESSRETLYLADAEVNSQIYGGKVYRSDHCVLIHTNANVVVS